MKLSILLLLRPLFEHNSMYSQHTLFAAKKTLAADILRKALKLTDLTFFPSRKTRINSFNTLPFNH